MSGREGSGLKNTVTTFWNTVWQNRVHVIIATETGIPAAPEYWPVQARASLSFGAITIVNKSVTHKSGFTVSTLGVSCKEGPREDERVVYHIHFLKWPTGWLVCLPSILICTC